MNNTKSNRGCVDDLLAAEYVLGTLEGQARWRFEDRMQHQQELRALVECWDLKLNRLAEDSLPVTPPPFIWKALARSIGARGPSGVPGQLLRKLSLWRGAAVASSLLAGLLGLLLLLPAPDSSPNGYVIMIRDQARHPVWVIDSSPDMAELQINTTAPMDMPAGKSCYLWIQADPDAPPHLLARLPDDGQAHIEVPVELRAYMPGRLLVSIENSAPRPHAGPSQLVPTNGEWMQLVNQST